jgi:hypothetical protein
MPIPESFFVIYFRDFAVVWAQVFMLNDCFVGEQLMANRVPKVLLALSAVATLLVNHAKAQGICEPHYAKREIVKAHVQLGAKVTFDGLGKIKNAESYPDGLGRCYDKYGVNLIGKDGRTLPHTPPGVLSLRPTVEFEIPPVFRPIYAGKTVVSYSLVPHFLRPGG